MALSVACSSSVVFFLLLAAANHPAMLFIHKLPTLLMHIVPSEHLSAFNVESAQMAPGESSFPSFPD